MSPRLAVLVFGLLVAACGSPESAPKVAGKTPQPAEPIGAVDAVEGEAFVWHDGKKGEAKPDSPVVARDRLETGARGKMRVRLRDDSKLALGPGTQVELRQLLLDDETRTGWIDVRVGKFWFYVTRWTGRGASRYDVATPNAVAGVRGTTLWGDTQVDAICALEGQIEVRSLRDRTLPAARLQAGNCASMLSKGRLEPLAPTSEQIEGFLDEVLIRGR
jgi:hypothetical protein